MSEDDPFEKLDPPADRDGDPFEQLGDEATEMAVNDADTEQRGNDSPGDAVESEAVESRPETESREAASHETATDDPFTGMDLGEGDPFASGESPFESVDVEALDDEDIWTSLDADSESAPSETNRYTDVSKHRFCEQCEFFADPPAAHCTHEEAELVEYLDMETVRLMNCPVVAQQRELEAEE